MPMDQAYNPAVVGVDLLGDVFINILRKVVRTHYQILWD